MRALFKANFEKTDMRIRIADTNDLDAIVRIYNQAIRAGQKTGDLDPFGTKDRIKWFEEHTPDKYPIFIAENSEMVIGYLTINAYRPGRMALQYTAEVSYFIDFDYHRQGVASALLKHAIDICPSLKIKTLIAIVIETNIASVKLLENNKFEKWGYLPKVAEIDGVEVGHLYYGLRI